MNTFSIEVSKRLREIGVEYKDTIYSFSWAVPSRGQSPQERLALDVQTEPELYQTCVYWGECYDTIPAYTLEDIFRLMPKIGKKMDFYPEIFPIPNSVGLHTHRIFDAFLSGDYPEAEKVLLDLLK